ncbi:uncharacterized protein BJ171DRAFT_168612 [Polychytrium aggregatum]|uniref:uncharacterized protein n=1 Tax=Polychytrium aggregatum TaxID=110093 RepID=UPI0022FE7EAF|nr:uncharacterized protein BJ171DRAFT_168612 [Polychytrium aggregatum]KAI9208803.1 hypothetical protein BJ171DRAFT_168612 [Polychytrium aggregatum]
MFRYERDDGDEDEDQYSSFGYERDLDPGSSSDEDDINSIQDQLLSHVHYTSSWMGASQSLPATVPKALMGKQDRSEPSDNGQSDDDNDNDNNNDSDNNSDDDDHDDNDDNDDNDDDKDKITNKNGDRDGVGSRSGNDIDRPKVRATPEDATLVGSIGSDPLSSPRPTIPPGSSAAASPITFQKQAIKPPVLQSSLKPQNDSLEVTHVIQPELFSAQLETKLADPKGITLAELLESRPTTVSNFTGLSHQIQCKFCRENSSASFARRTTIPQNARLKIYASIALDWAISERTAP